MEKEVAGIYLSGHPLDEYRDELRKMNYPGIGEITGDESEYSDGNEVSLVGIISERRDKLTRSNTNMAFITIEDFTGSMEVIVFPKILSKIDSILLENSTVMLHGRLDIKEDDGAKLILDSAVPFTGANDCLTLNLNDEQLMQLDKLRAIASQHPGAYCIQIECSYGNITTNNIHIDASRELKDKICRLFGENVVKEN